MKFVLSAFVGAVVLLATIGIRASESSPQSGTASDPIVYVTKTGTKYHLDGCRSLRQSKIPMKLSEAVKRYGPCLQAARAAECRVGGSACTVERRGRSDRVRHQDGHQVPPRGMSESEPVRDSHEAE
jgi:hypothetical protein